MTDLGTTTIGVLIRHAGRWLSNLRRAGGERQRQSRQALRRVIVAARETTVYLRQLRDCGSRDHGVERHLTVLWTELGFELQDLGLEALAKRCQLTGKHWADPDAFDPQFLRRADLSLERMERLAREILARSNA